MPAHSDIEKAISTAPAINFPAGRVPPQSIEGEQAILGALLLGDTVAIEAAREIVTEEDFYRKAHGLIFHAVLTLCDRSEPVDIVTLQDELNRSGYLEPIGGIGYLMQLGEFVPTTANVEYYAQIVKDKAIKRRIIEATSRVAVSAYQDETPARELLATAEKELLAVD